MAPHKNKKVLLVGITVALFGLSFFVVVKTLHRGTYEFATIPVAPGPATPGAISPGAGSPGTAEPQANVGVPVITGSGVDRRLAGVAPGAGIAAGVHGGSSDNSNSGTSGTTTQGPLGTQSGGLNSIGNGVGATPGGGTPGMIGGAPGATVGQGQTAQDQGVPVVVDKPAVTCFTVTYKHKVTPGHDSEEACSHHKNLVRLKHKDVNPASICMRVNGTPVRFTTSKTKPDELMLGAVAGPHATITASYCIGKVKCAEACKIPRDEFLDAIGGSGNEGGPDGLAMGQWEASQGAQNPEAEKDRAKNAKLVGDMKRELSSLDGPDSAGDGYTLFQDWIADDGAPSCEKAQVDSTGTRVADLARRRKGE